MTRRNTNRATLIRAAAAAIALGACFPPDPLTVDNTTTPETSTGATIDIVPDVYPSLEDCAVVSQLRAEPSLIKNTDQQVFAYKQMFVAAGDHYDAVATYFVPRDDGLTIRMYFEGEPTPENVCRKVEELDVYDSGGLLSLPGGTVIVFSPNLDGDVNAIDQEIWAGDGLSDRVKLLAKQGGVEPCDRTTKIRFYDFGDLRQEIVIAVKDSATDDQIKKFQTLLKDEFGPSVMVERASVFFSTQLNWPVLLEKCDLGTKGFFIDPDATSVPVNRYGIGI